MKLRRKVFIIDSDKEFYEALNVIEILSEILNEYIEDKRHCKILKDLWMNV